MTLTGKLYSFKQLTKKRKAGKQVRQDQIRKGHGTDIHEEVAFLMDYQIRKY
jgi:hypothetical protein